MKEMTLREKIGQMIMTGFAAAEVTPELEELIKKEKIANIILFSYNQESVPQLRRLCMDLHQRIEKSTGYPAFIAADQEGGVVTRMPKEASNVPGAMLIGAAGKKEYAYQAGLITGTELKAFGINVDFAPVMDINSNPNNPVIGVRSYSSDPHMVEKFGLNMQRGLLDAGVMATVKHFPGHGDTAVDSHLGLPVIDKEMDSLMKEELIPFIRAIDEGVPCVMTTHILFPRLESQNVPATLSKTILTGLLREKLGFQGIIITDCLEMGAIKDHYGTAYAAVEAVKAGAQMLCISHTPEVVRESMRRLEEAVLSGELPMELIDAAVENILKYKKEFQVDSAAENLEKIGCEEHKRAIREMALAGITKVSEGELPEITKDTLFIGSYAYRSTIVSSPVDKRVLFAEYMAGQMGGDFLEVPLNPSKEDVMRILREVRNYSKVVYGLYNGHLNPGQIELANEISRGDQTLVAVTLRNPTDLALLEKKIHKIAAYEYNTVVFDGLIKVLSKQADAAGILPVRLR